MHSELVKLKKGDFTAAHTRTESNPSEDGLWKIMAKLGCPPRFIAMVRQFHDGMQARLQNDGEFSEPFEVTNEVKHSTNNVQQMFSAMLMDAFQDCDTGFPITALMAIYST